MNVREISRLLLRPDRGAVALYRGLRRLATIDDVVLDLYDPRRGGRRGGSRGGKRKRLERVHLRRSEGEGPDASESWTVMQRERSEEPAPRHQIEGEAVEAPALSTGPTDADEDVRPS